MPPERQQEGRLRDFGLDADSVLVRPVGGQIYLIEESEERAPWGDETPPARSPLSGLINRH